ncbi:unnamed protein product [Adineta steineri]|uniref:Uncharacterized protein n=1 Tax=Adineta steineri TaxID=433720 RepID=A0A815VG39_9BILA|nr:unnamed protein product [Adineta steineri]CAF1653320.1 unnamed protein product [Adineta steineri]
MDVLYSFVDINNERLNILAQENIFTNILNFVSIDNISVVDRFCNDILPRIHHNVKCFIFDPIFMERILLATDYPNLTKLTIAHFQKEIASNYFTKGRNRVIDGTYVQRNILDYMPQLRSFTFYICTYINLNVLSYKLSSEDIQQTLINNGQQHVRSMASYVTNIVSLPLGIRTACSIFSLPFKFNYIQDIGNNLPNIVFNYVIYLVIEDITPFEHEFFMRIARSFPLLKHLCIQNKESQKLDGLMTFSPDNCQLRSIIEYPHLTILDVIRAHKDYVEQFLNETKTFVPCLMEFAVSCVDDLKAVTKDFTKEETRRNCAKVTKITTTGGMVHSEDLCLYFPSLYK